MGSEESKPARSPVRRVIVVGAGISGLTTALYLGEASVPVLLMSLAPARRSPSVMDQSGFNVVLDGSSRESDAHFDDSVSAADFLVHQAPLRCMLAAAPKLIGELCRIGVPFLRSGDGRIATIGNAGTHARRTAFAGTTTGQQVLYALDDQVRRLEQLPARDRHGRDTGEAVVERREGWEFLGLIQDDEHRAVGVVAREISSGVVKPFRADAVCMATGSMAGLYADSVGSPMSNGAAAASVHRQGAIYANPEFIQFHPTAARTMSKLRGISELARGNGARLFATKAVDAASAGDVPEKDRDYFLEREYPGLGNRVPDDVAARSVHRILGRKNQDGSRDKAVFIDVRHLEARERDRVLGVSLRTHLRLSGEDASLTPLSVQPGAATSLGGLWVDHEVDATGELAWDSPRNHATSIRGMFAVGECCYQYRGAGVLSGNGLVGRVFGGRVAASAIRSYVDALPRSAWDLPPSLFEKTEERERAELAIITKRESDDEGDTPEALRRALGKALQSGAGVERSADGLRKLSTALDELDERISRVHVVDGVAALNQSVMLARQLPLLLLLARLVTAGAERRTANAGVHFRKDATDAAPGSAGPRLSLLRFDDGGSQFVTEFEVPGGSGSLRIDDGVDSSRRPPRTRDDSQTSRAKTK